MILFCLISLVADTEFAAELEQAFSAVSCQTGSQAQKHKDHDLSASEYCAPQSGPGSGKPLDKRLVVL